MLQQLEDDWHIVVSSSLVLCLPIGLTLLFGADLIVLYLQRLGQLGHARLDGLIRLTGQLEHFFLADFELSEATCLFGSELVRDFLGAPGVESCEPLVLLLENLDLVSNNGEEIEPDLVAGVVLNALLYLLTSQRQPCVLRALAMGDRTTLQTIKFVKSIFEGDKADEMEDIVVLGRRLRLLFHNEGILSSEAIVGHSDHFGVANRVTFLL